MTPNKSFKNMTPQQVERLARLNKERSEKDLESEKDARGLDKSKKRSYTNYVDRSVDPDIEDASADQMFRIMSKRPYQE